MYACDKACYDYHNGHVCKHIHRVHSKGKEEIAASVGMNLGSPSSQDDAPHANSPAITYTTPTARTPAAGQYHIVGNFQTVEIFA